MALKDGLLVECDGPGAGPDLPRTRSIGRLIERIAGPLIVSDRERLFPGQNHADTSQSLRNLAAAHSKAGHKEEAERYRQRAQSMKSASPDNP